MRRALSSFVIIKSNFDAGEDYIGAFVPLLLLLFDSRNYQTVNIESICRDFTEEYGIQIPRYPMITIVNRMKKYVKRVGGEFRVNQKEVKKETQNLNFQEEFTKYDWLLKHFISFCEQFTPEITITSEKADHLLTTFFKEHDLDIIFAVSGIEPISILPDDIDSDRHSGRYLVNRYVNLLMEEGGQHAKYLIDSAIGHNYASTILYREFATIRGKGIAEKYYFDSNILFDLIGVNGEFRRKSTVSFLSMLISKGAELFVFRHNYEELLRILEGCLAWIDSNYYDPEKASRALQFFKDEGYSAANIQLFIADIPNVIRKNKINTIDTPDPNIDQFYQISEDALRDVILETYTASGIFFDEEERDYTLQRDIVSISSIYKLRRDRIPTNLNDVTHVFVSSNSGFAYASTKFEQRVKNRGFFTIPTVLTDTFVGTLIWASEPADIVEDFSRSKLIAYTNAVIQPSATLIRNFSQEVIKAQDNTSNPISENSAMVLLESGLSRHLLSDITLGDPNRVTDQTPYDVLAELKRSLSAEERARAEEALNFASKEREGRERAERNLFDLRRKMSLWISNASSIIKWLIIIVLTLVSLLLLGIAIFSDQDALWQKIIIYVISGIGFVSGFSVLAFGKKVEEKVKKYLTKRLVK